MNKKKIITPDHLGRTRNRGNLFDASEALTERIEQLEAFYLSRTEGDLRYTALENGFLGAAPGWAGAVSMLRNFPGLVGCWPGGYAGSTQLRDYSTGGRHMSVNGNPKAAADSNLLISYMVYDGTGDYFNHADDSALSVTGTETGRIDTPGLTLLTWAYFDSALSGPETVIGKWFGTTSLSYKLVRAQTSGVVRFTCTSDGTSGTQQTVNSSNAIVEDAWVFMAGRFTPSSRLDCWHDGLKSEFTTSVNSSIFDGTQDFTIGAISGGGENISGNLCLTALCEMAVPDHFIYQFYNYTKLLFTGA